MASEYAQAEVGRRSRLHREHLTDGDPTGSILTKGATRVLALGRILVGFIFLWAFLDKLFGLGYSTASKKSWLNGGSPTKGFLSHVEVGPLQSTMRSIAGHGWADWLFMLGLLGIGVALVAGVALRIAAVSATLMLALMWAAEWPPARHTSGGTASSSTNPIVDYHVIYAIVAILAALAYAGHTWGLGRWWASRSFVQKNRWLI